MHFYMLHLYILLQDSLNVQTLFTHITNYTENSTWTVQVLVQTNCQSNSFRVIFLWTSCYVKNCFDGHDKLINLCIIWVTYLVFKNNAIHLTYMYAHIQSLHILVERKIKQSLLYLYAKPGYDFVSFNMFWVNFV